MANNQNNHEQQNLNLGRILCLTSSFPASDSDFAGIFVYNLARDLSEQGWRVDVLVPHSPGLPTREIRDGIGIWRFRYLWPESIETLGSSGSNIVTLRNRPLNYFKIVPLVLFQVLKTLQMLFSRRYDVIHSHWIIPQGFPGMIGSMVKGIPHVVTVHGGDIYSFNNCLLRKLKSAILNTATAITANSTATMKQVGKIVSAKNLKHTIPMGISCVQPKEGETLALRKKYRFGNGPLLLFVGRIVEEKGVGDFIRVLHILQNDLPDIRALIVGEGQEKEFFDRLAHKLGVGDRVVFAGQVAPDRVGDYYGAADIFIGPSKKAKDGWTEGLGMTFIEAMFARTPVVATKSGGIVDAVRHEKTGLLVDEDSPEEIAAAVKRLLEDQQLIHFLVENGYVLAKEHYSRNASVQKFTAVFKKVMESI